MFPRIGYVCVRVCESVSVCVVAIDPKYTINTYIYIMFTYISINQSLQAEILYCFFLSVFIPPYTYPSSHVLSEPSAV